MTEQQLEILEHFFPDGGVIVHRQPNKAFEVCCFGCEHTPVKLSAMNRLVDFIVDHGGLPTILNETEAKFGEKI